ncbi:MAG: DUF2087 domain-containing protein [Anaerolineaceae bacterium]|nr:DUF2087 domain-containing protein [Anaerolineaceae bacterium]
MLRRSLVDYGLMARQDSRGCHWRLEEESGQH